MVVVVIVYTKYDYALLFDHDHEGLGCAKGTNFPDVVPGMPRLPSKQNR